jgi:hypothetical protein
LNITTRDPSGIEHERYGQTVLDRRFDKVAVKTIEGCIVNENHGRLSLHITTRDPNGIEQKRYGETALEGWMIQRDSRESHTSLHSP